MAEHLTFEESQTALRKAADAYERRYPELPKLSGWSIGGSGYHIFANAVIDMWLEKNAADGVKEDQRG